MQNFVFSGGFYGGLFFIYSEVGFQLYGIYGIVFIGGLLMLYLNFVFDVDLMFVVLLVVNMNFVLNFVVYNFEVVNEFKKKKYVKEVWLGKKFIFFLLI